MDEPSVLDYLKAKLAFWKKSDLQFPDLAENPQLPDQALAGDLPLSTPSSELVSDAFKGLPWMAILALVFAFMGQMVIEPPARAAGLGLAFYAIAALFAAAGMLRKQVALADVEPEPEPHPQTPSDDLRLPWLVSVAGITLGAVIFLAKSRSLENSFWVDILLALMVTLVAGSGVLTAWYGFHRLPSLKPKLSLAAPVLGSLALIMLAFLTLGENRLNLINLAAWLATLTLTALQFFQFDWKAAAERWKAGLPQSFRLQVSGYAFLFLVVLVVVAVFRFYDLNGLPGEMFSDHAEKLLDVNDVMNGQLKIYFERNTGREMFQFYWTALMAIVFNTGISFLSLKIGTALVGLITLYYIFRLGDELGGKWVALYALFFAGVAYWPNIISRIGLRFPLYPFCVAPVLFYLLRGLRRQKRNDFIWGGIWLGIGLHGYTASRIVPLVVLAAFALFLIHRQSRGRRKEAIVWLAILAFVSFVVFLPLFRYALDNPELVNYRSLTRMGSVERPLEGSPLAIFASNAWNAMVMFFWDNGDVWVHSIPHRPALAAIDAALFFCGVLFLIGRYLKRLHWRDLFLLVSIPILLLPSMLSLAFPNENPNLNRTAGVYVPVFLIVGLGFDALMRAVRQKMTGKTGLAVVAAAGLLLASGSAAANGDLFFNQYASEYRLSAWNTTEMGQVMGGFTRLVGTAETAWVVGYPYWVDTRLVGINAGFVLRNPEISVDQIADTGLDPRPKLFLLNPADTPALDRLRSTFPQASYWLHASAVPGKEFIIFLVSASADALP